jgi:hypothetical protein
MTIEYLTEKTSDSEDRYQEFQDEGTYNPNQSLASQMSSQRFVRSLPPPGAEQKRHLRKRQLSVRILNNNTNISD